MSRHPAMPPDSGVLSSPMLPSLSRNVPAMPTMKPDTEAPAEQQRCLRSWEQKHSLQGNLGEVLGREPPALSHDLTHAVSLLVSVGISLISVA